MEITITLSFGHRTCDGRDDVTEMMEKLQKSEMKPLYPGGLG